MTPENIVRLSALIIVLVIMVGWELVRPKRSCVMRKARWPSNFGIVFLNAIMLTALPVTAIEASLFSIYNKFGLFIWLKTPLWPSIILSLIILDLVIYWQHRIFHLFHPLWRIHRMHHADLAIDVSTGLRFHPIEIFLSILIKATVIIFLGVPVLAVIAFEVILNASAMFNHSNIHLPKPVDRWVRFLFVTPDMHRVHHSALPEEHDNNFGFCLSLWDRLFSSYTEQPRAGHSGMTIGLDQFGAAEESRLDRMLTQPFR